LRSRADDSQQRRAHDYAERIGADDVPTRRCIDTKLGREGRHEAHGRELGRPNREPTKGQDRVGKPRATLGFGSHYRCLGHVEIGSRALIAFGKLAGRP